MKDMKMADRKTANILKPEGYRPRVLDTRLEKLLGSFGCVEITGPKWCGKTWIGLAHARSVDRLDDPAVLSAAKMDASLVLEGNAPHLVDEWQEVPEIWDAVRRRVDERGNSKGLFILTGSSKPKSNEIHHSGTGRIARLHMRSMSLFETGDSNGSVSLARIFDGDFKPKRRKTETADIARWCCRGGWPSILGIEDDFAFETPREYIRSVLDISVRSLNKNPAIAQKLMLALSLNLTQPVTYKVLARDMALDDEDAMPSAPTIEAYLDLLKDLFLIEDLTGWEPPLISKRRVRTKPKHFFVDPSLPGALLGATPATLLRDMQTLGKLFESLCIRDLRVYLSVLPGIGNQINYYLDDKGLEVDAVVQLGDGRWGAFEIKLSDAKIDEAAGCLNRFADKIALNKAAQVRDPEFLAVLIGKGDLAYQRKDGVLVIPIATLAP
jgi:predicted AAA+ superfamily ATPase